MKILAHKAAPGAYAFNLDDIEVVLESKKIKILILEVMQTLAPGSSTVEEDPIYQIKNGVPKQRTKEAVKRLIKIAKELKVKGTLIYENLMSNLAFAGKP
jgi:hypothetical protein